MYEIKAEDVYEDSSKDKKCLISVISQNFMKIQTNQWLANWKMKHLVLQLQNLLDFFLVDDSSEHKKPKGVNKNVVATIIHGEYKDVLLKTKKMSGTFDEQNPK